MNCFRPLFVFNGFKYRNEDLVVQKTWFSSYFQSILDKDLNFRRYRNKGDFAPPHFFFFEVIVQNIKSDRRQFKGVSYIDSVFHGLSCLFVRVIFLK